MKASSVVKLKPDPDAESPVTTGKRPKLADFPQVLAELALEMAQQAKKLKPVQQFDLRLDTFKALVTYQAMLNKANEGEEGGGIADLRSQLENTPVRDPDDPETEDEEQEDGGAEDA
jgi:hypothetical protein